MMQHGESTARDTQIRKWRWMDTIRRSALFVTAIFLITIAVRINDFIDFSETALERMNFIKSPTLRLAENTARSDFSERLTRMAWRRLYWGRLAGQRIIDEAPIGDIDVAWSTYINASAEWNTEVMILIVGLEKYYGAARRQFFEGQILNLFNAFDDALRAIRRSGEMRKLRDSQIPTEVDRTEIRGLFDTLKSRTGELNYALYDFIVCFEPGKDVKDLCKSIVEAARIR
jgi:hypothetical protein